MGVAAVEGTASDVAAAADPEAGATASPTATPRQTASGTAAAVRRRGGPEGGGGGGRDWRRCIRPAGNVGAEKKQTLRKRGCVCTRELTALHRVLGVLHRELGVLHRALGGGVGAQGARRAKFRVPCTLNQHT